MPSPFPGVDPYVEAQGLWGGFQVAFTTYVSDRLNETMPARYIAHLRQHRRFVDVSDEELELVSPDVAAATPGRNSTMHSLARTPQPRIRFEMREVWIEILGLPIRKPVGVIELLSPINKLGEGYLKYALKRQATLRQKVHLIEIDFLLGGRRLPVGRPHPAGDFYALVSHADERPESHVYTWTIRDPLPTLPIPLSQPDPDVIVDLGPLFATAYERGRYARLIDYSIPPSTVKKPADRAWAERTARAARR